jgi:hypothetical protein
MNGMSSARIVPAVGVSAHSVTSRGRRVTARRARAALALSAHNVGDPRVAGDAGIRLPLAR